MFHVHKWTNLSYQHQTIVDGGGQRTLFSQTCRCGEWRIVEQHGLWMLEDGFPVAAFKERAKRG